MAHTKTHKHTFMLCKHNLQIQTHTQTALLLWFQTNNIQDESADIGRYNQMKSDPSLCYKLQHGSGRPAAAVASHPQYNLMQTWNHTFTYSINVQFSF